MLLPLFDGPQSGCFLSFLSFFAPLGCPMWVFRLYFGFDAVPFAVLALASSASVLVVGVVLKEVLSRMVVGRFWVVGRVVAEMASGTVLVC